MKHVMTILALFTSLFLLTSCGKTASEIIDDLPDDIADLLPSIEILGDGTITVEQYTVFTDPGADVAGDYDLDITVVSDVNTDILGDYTVVYSVVYEGTTYSGTRTVRVVAPSALLEPDVTSFVCEEGFTTIDCSLEVNTSGLTDVRLRVEVWKDGQYHSLFWANDSNTLIEILSLDSGTEYGIKLYTDYYVTGSDEMTAYVLLDELSVTTKALDTYTVPSIENLVITTDIGNTNSVTFDFDYIDPDGAITGRSWFIMSQVESSPSDSEEIFLGHNTVTFTGYPVYPNTLYNLFVSTDYQIDDENFTWSTKIFEDTLLTPPDVQALSFSAEQSVYFFADRFILNLELDNKEDLNVEYVTINGIKIYKDDFIFPSTNSHIYVDMGVETDYTDYNYHLTNFALTQSDESSYVFTYDETLSFRLKEPGSIDPVEAEVSILEITTTDYTRHLQDGVLDYASVTIHLDNPYNLPIVSVTLNNVVYPASSFDEGSTLKQIVLHFEIDDGYNSAYVKDLVFTKNGVATDSLTDRVPSIYIYGYQTEDVVNIGSAVALNSIDTSEQDKIYILSADIDMQTILNFSPIGTQSSPLNGVFDGNGHTIYNLNYSSTSSDQSATDYIGLFGYSNAYLYDITLTNMEFNVLTNADHTLYIGALAGYSTGTILNCSTWGTNTINIEGITQGYVGGLVGSTSGYVRDAIANTSITIDGLNNEEANQEVIVGGLLGTYEKLDLNTSSSSGSIMITNTYRIAYHVGGLIGRFANEDYMNTVRVSVINSFSTVDISTSNYGTGYVGGLIGQTYGKVGVINSYASGDVYSQRGDLGGLVGDSYTFITNSFSVGDISSDSAHQDKLTPDRFDHYMYYLLNDFVYDGASLTSGGNPGYEAQDYFGYVITASAEEYNDDDFYTRILGWSPYFYNFEGLNIEFEKLPTHN